MAGSTVFPAIIRPQYDPAGGFPKMVEDARNSAGQIKRQFETDFAEIGRLASKALSLPRNAGGSLDLGADQYREAARNAQAHAIALRELATAAATAARSTGDTSRATTTYVQAARAAAIEAERGARDANALATAHERLQAELNQTKSATDRVVAATGLGTTANHMVVNSQRAVRQSTIQMGQQLQDVAISLHGGQRASTVFAQQLPQLAFALSGAGGKVGAIATLLSGPWSLAVVAAGAGLGVLIDKFIRTGDAADKTKDATLSLSEALRSYGDTAKDVGKALDEYNAAQGQQRDNAERMIKINLALAESNLKVALSTREKLAAELARRDADLDPSNVPFGADETYIAGVTAARGYTQSRVDANAAAVARLAEATRNLRIDFGQREAEAAVDPVRQINNLYDDMAAAAEAAAAANNKLSRSIGSTLTGIEKQRKAALDAQREATKAGRSGSGLYGREIDSAQARSIAEAAGLRVTDGDRTITQQRWLYDNKRTATNPVAYPDANAPHVRRNALDIGFAPGVTAQSIRKAYADEGVRLTKILKEDGHFHIEWSTSGADRVEREAEQLAEAAQRAAEAARRLAEFGREAGVSIIAMNDRFAETPQAVMQSRAALEQINDLIGQLQDKQPAGFAEMVKSLEAMKPAAEALADGPFADMVKASEEQARIQQLLIEGREIEAEVLSRQLGPLRENKALSAQQLADLRQMVVQDRLRSAELEKQNAIRQREVALIEATQDNIRQTTYELLKGGGFGAIGNLFKRQWDLMLQNLADSLTESLFGDFFASQKDKALGFDKVKEASLEQARVADKVTAAFERLAEASDNLETAFDKEFGTSPAGAAAAANDNAPDVAEFGEIVVRGQRSAAKAIKDALNTGLKAILGDELFGKFGKVLETVSRGAALGQIGGGLVGRPGVGAAIGGVIGGELGKLGGAALGKAIGGIGSALGPIGSAVGSILGGLVGGLFGSKPPPPSGRSTVTQDDIKISANEAQITQNLSSVGHSLQNSVISLARALGGKVGPYEVGIGQKYGFIQVSSIANDPLLATDNFGRRSPYALADTEDPAEAARAALLGAIEDGAIRGIREGATRLLKAGKNIDAQIQKAIDFQGVFDELQSIKDPLGYAIDKLNKQFSDLIDVFKEAGATAEENAQLEELYGLKRAAAIKQANDAITSAVSSTLKDLIAQLEIGDSGLSLRDRMTNAQAAYNPLAEAIRSGQTVDYQAFSDAAQSVLDISRQLYGSQQEYFATFNDVLGLSKQALAKTGGNVIPLDQSGLAGSPFVAAPAGTGTTSAANDNAGLVSALDQLGYAVTGGTDLAALAAQLAAVNSNLGALIQQGLASGTITPNFNLAFASWF